MKAIATHSSPEFQNRTTSAPTPAAPPGGFTIRRILVPIDFSPHSVKALQYAIPLANRFRARICLLHVAEGYYPISPLGPVDPTSAEARSRGDAAGRLAQFATREIARQVPVDITARSGYPSAEILRAAREFYVDLIVISTRAYTGLKHLLAGSTTESVVRRASCPVLVVREHEHEFVCDASTKNDSNLTPNLSQA
jgi:nucleotide-binding universal stress UspA family protein